MFYALIDHLLMNFPFLFISRASYVSILGSFGKSSCCRYFYDLFAAAAVILASIFILLCLFVIMSAIHNFDALFCCGDHLDLSFFSMLGEAVFMCWW